MAISLYHSGLMADNESFARADSFTTSEQHAALFRHDCLCISPLADPLGKVIRNLSTFPSKQWLDVSSRTVFVYRVQLAWLSKISV